MCIYIYIYVYMCVCIYVYIYIYMYECMCMYNVLTLSLSIYIYTYAHNYIDINIFLLLLLLLLLISLFLLSLYKLQRSSVTNHAGRATFSPHACLFLGVQGCCVSGCGVSNYDFQNPSPISALGVKSPHLPLLRVNSV